MENNFSNAIGYGQALGKGTCKDPHDRAWDLSKKREALESRSSRWLQ